MPAGVYNSNQYDTLSLEKSCHIRLHTIMYRTIQRIEIPVHLFGCTYVAGRLATSAAPVLGHPDRGKHWPTLLFFPSLNIQISF